jgi:hypothetical protein
MHMFIILVIITTHHARQSLLAFDRFFFFLMFSSSWQPGLSLTPRWQPPVLHLQHSSQKVKTRCTPVSGTPNARQQPHSLEDPRNALYVDRCLITCLTEVYRHNACIKNRGKLEHTASAVRSSSSHPPPMLHNLRQIELSMASSTLPTATCTLIVSVLQGSHVAPAVVNVLVRDSAAIVYIHMSTYTTAEIVYIHGRDRLHT